MAIGKACLRIIPEVFRASCELLGRSVNDEPLSYRPAAPMRLQLLAFVF
jgi:hypothetical protein